MLLRNAAKSQLSRSPILARSMSAGERGSEFAVLPFGRDLRQRWSRSYSWPAEPCRYWAQLRKSTVRQLHSATVLKKGTVKQNPSGAREVPWCSRQPGLRRWVSIDDVVGSRRALQRGSGRPRCVVDMHEAIDALSFTDNRNLLLPHLIGDISRQGRRASDRADERRGRSFTFHVRS